MDFFQAKDFFEEIYPGKKITYDFDVNCLRKLEFIHTDGKPNPVHHLEYNKVKVSVANEKSFYAPIMPHRECCTWEYAKKHIISLPDPIEKE